MSSEDISVILKRFDNPDETRNLVKGKFEVVHLGGMTCAREDAKTRRAKSRLRDLRGFA